MEMPRQLDHIYQILTKFSNICKIKFIEKEIQNDG